MDAMRLCALWLPGLTLIRPGSGTGPGDPTVPACSNSSFKSCEECLKNVSCLWCNRKNTCMDYPVRSILPSSSLCPLYDARWGVCWIYQMKRKKGLPEIERRDECNLFSGNMKEK